MQPYQHTLWLAVLAMCMGYQGHAMMFAVIGFVFSLFDTTRKRF